MFESTASESTVYSVPDISCDHCVNAITKEVTAVDGVTGLDIDLAAKTVSVVGGDSTAIVAAIDQAGFDVA